MTVKHMGKSLSGMIIALEIIQSSWWLTSFYAKQYEAQCIPEQNDKKNMHIKGK